MKRLMTIIVLLVFSAGSGKLFAGIAAIDNHPDTLYLYYSKDIRQTKPADLKADLNVKTLVFQLDITYDTAVFKLDTQSLAPGTFLTDTMNVLTDTYIFTIIDDTKAGSVNITGARMVFADAYKGLQGLYSLISDIKFNLIDTSASIGKTVYVKNFKFVDTTDTTYGASVDNIPWKLFLRILTGDMNFDNVVNSADFSYFRKIWKKNQNITVNQSTYDYDINESGIIDNNDFSEFKKNFGKR